MRLTGLSHVHELNSVLLFVILIGCEVYLAETTLSNLLVPAIVVQNGTEIE